MKSPFLARIFAFVFFGLAFAPAVFAEPESGTFTFDANDENWGEARSELQLSIRAGEPEYQVGSKIAICIVVRNVSQANIKTWTQGTALGPYRLEIVAPSGESALFTDLGKARIAEPQFVFSCCTFILDPNEMSPHWILALNEYYDMRSPGKYTVVAKRDVPDPDNPGKWLELVSNKMTINVVAEK